MAAVILDWIFCAVFTSHNKTVCVPNIALHCTAAPPGAVDRYRHFVVTIALAPTVTVSLQQHECRSRFESSRSSSPQQFAAWIQTTQNECNYNLPVCSWFNKERLVIGRSHLTGQRMCLAPVRANKEISPYVQMSNYMCRNHRQDMCVCIDVDIRLSTVYLKMVFFLSKWCILVLHRPDEAKDMDTYDKAEYFKISTSKTRSGTCYRPFAKWLVRQFMKQH